MKNFYHSNVFHDSLLLLDGRDASGNQPSFLNQIEVKITLYHKIILFPTIFPSFLLSPHSQYLPPKNFDVDRHLLRNCSPYWPGAFFFCSTKGTYFIYIILLKMSHYHSQDPHHSLYVTNSELESMVGVERPLLVVSSPPPLEAQRERQGRNTYHQPKTNARPLADVPASPNPGGASEVSQWFPAASASGTVQMNSGNGNSPLTDSATDEQSYFSYQPSPQPVVETRPLQTGPMIRRASVVSARSVTTPQHQNPANFSAQNNPIKPSPLGGGRRGPTSRPGSVFSIDSRYSSAPIPIAPPRVADNGARHSRLNSTNDILSTHQNSTPILRSVSSSTPHLVQRVNDPQTLHAFGIHNSNTPRVNANIGFRPALQPIMQTPTDTAADTTVEMDSEKQPDHSAAAQRHPPPHYNSFVSSLTNLYGRMWATHDGKKTSDAHLANRNGSLDSISSDGTLYTHHGRENGMATILGFHDEPMEPDDPRLTGFRRKSVEEKRPFIARRTMSTRDDSFCTRNSQANERGRSRSFGSLVNATKNHKVFNGGLIGKKEHGYHSSMESHIDRRRKFILKMARALMLFGAPSHRVESQLNALSGVLHVDAQFIHFPGIVIASFGESETNLSQTHFVKSKTEIALGRLNELHALYKEVMSDKIPIADASLLLDEMFSKPPEWSNLSRILFSIVKCGMMAPINFGGSFVDIWISALFGGMLTFSQLCLAGNNQMFSNVFDIAVAILFSFVSRALSVKSVFCYEAVASSGLIGLLPGYAVLCASLELASKNMMTGSVRMVYAVIYSLFLGFAISIGSDLYYWIDPKARKDVFPSVAEQVQVMGSFILSNETMPHWTGSFTFTNSTTPSIQHSVSSIGCFREPNWPWWRQSVPPVSKAATVPIFSFLSCLGFLLPLKTKEVPVSVLIACIGYAANMLANNYIFDRSDVVSAIGSFVIGILGNAYSRIYNATAFTAITVAVNFLVPSGMAMAGGLAMTYQGSDGDLYTNGLSLGFRMVQVSIGITTGLFVSAILVHMLGNKRSNAVLFAF